MATATQAKLAEADFLELQCSLRGELVRPDDPSYDDQRRVWNGSISRRPALIARCTGVADVIAAVQFASRTGMEVAVRSGGHSFPGLSVADDSMMIDLSALKGVRVDPQKRTARVQAGVLLGELDRETQAFGLAAPSGIVTRPAAEERHRAPMAGERRRRLVEGGLAGHEERRVPELVEDGIGDDHRASAREHR